MTKSTKPLKKKKPPMRPSDARKDVSKILKDAEDKRKKDQPKEWGDD